MRKPILTWLAPALVLAVASASAHAAKASSAAAAAPTVWVYQPTGGLQCEPARDTPQRLEAAAASLRAAGVAVLQARCATDGLMRAQRCGLPDGSLHALQIPASAESLAVAAGYAPATRFAQAQFQPCRREP